MKKPRPEIREVESVGPFDDPEKLMPLPDRLKKPIEAPVGSLKAETEASVVEDVHREAEIVETDSLETIRTRKNAHQTKLRR